MSGSDWIPALTNFPIKDTTRRLHPVCWGIWIQKTPPFYPIRTVTETEGEHKSETLWGVYAPHPGGWGVPLPFSPKAPFFKPIFFDTENAFFCQLLLSLPQPGPTSLVWFPPTQGICSKEEHLDSLYILFQRNQHLPFVAFFLCSCLVFKLGFQFVFIPINDGILEIVRPLAPFFSLQELSRLHLLPKSKMPHPLFFGCPRFNKKGLSGNENGVKYGWENRLHNNYTQ